MRLISITVQKFRNFVEPQTIAIEDDVTCLVGKNESGKTTILRALHRLRPANGTDTTFDLTTEYPRWRLARDRKANEALAKTRPISADFTLDDDDREFLRGEFGVTPPEATVCHSAKDYENSWFVWLTAPTEALIRQAAGEVDLGEDELTELLSADGVDAAQAMAKELAKTLKESEPLRAKACTAFASQIIKYKFLVDNSLIEKAQRDALGARMPSFFYFSNYNVLPGQCDLTRLAEKIAAEENLTAGERTVIALLDHAGETPADFMDADYDSRKAELQAASVDLSRQAFEYWKQNDDLEVVFDTDNVVKRRDPAGNETAHRILKIELRDGRHGNVETNFATRSTGFQWFFSFFAAFSEYQDSDRSVVVLLDEPGTSLHGDAQRDFVRFIFGELGQSKQTIYTTHSQHMVDPTRYEKLRAVHDRATRKNPDLGVTVSLASLSADRSTILPIESALGYSVSQHLFLGSGHHLAVEGSSDFVYLQRMTEYLVANGKTGLDARFAVIPVGGADNMPAFVALLGRRLKVSALIDGAKTGSKITRVKAAAKANGVAESAVVACSQADGALPATADIEDLFDVADYLKLYNWAFGTAYKATDLPETSEPILRRLEVLRGDEFDHALPAHALTDHRDEFFAGLKSKSASQFEKLLTLLNGTLDS